MDEVTMTATPAKMPDPMAHNFALGIIAAPDFYTQAADGYWCGIWNDRATAELVLSKGNPMHGETLVSVRAVTFKG